jgi:uncharacterized protein
MIDPRIISIIRRIKPELRRKFGVTRIGCFDCYIDHHHNKLCDLNVLVELEQPLGWDYFALKEFLQKKLEIHIDIFTPNAIKPAMKEDVMKEVHFI